MLPSQVRIYLHILGILNICMKFILSCDYHVCLTWEANKNDNITFKCKVSPLRFEVHFINPADEDQGFCSSPFPATHCLSSHKSISQDLQSNTTFLVIQKHVDSRLNGQWKCRHGHKSGEAFVNVTVLIQETPKTVFKNDTCGEQHMAWTFIGVTIGVLLIFILRIVFKTCQWNNEAIDCLKKHWSERRCMCRKKCYYATKLFTCVLLMCFTMCIAYVNGLQEKSCKDKQLFIIVGICMVFIFVICISIPGKELLVNHEGPVIHFRAANSHVSLELQGEQNDTAKHFEPANNEALLGTETVAEQTDNTYRNNYHTINNNISS